MKIFKIWIGDKPLPDIYKKYTDTWNKISGGEIVEIGNEYIEKVKDSAAVQWGLKNKNWAVVNHYIRYHLLFEQGGIYMDLDVEVVRDSPIWSNKNLHLGMELPNWANNHVMVCNLDCHFFFMDCMIVMNCMPYEQMQEVELNTGPRLVTRLLRDYQFPIKEVKEIISIDEFIYLHPERVFSPHRWNQKFDPSEIKEDTLAVHHFSKSW